jgi:SP family galactose:H+ symporter-like MFS transporter
MAPSAAVACGALSILNGMFFGYALIGVSTAAFTVWRCMYDLAEETPQNRWAISTLFSIINVGGLPYGFAAGYIMDNYGRRVAVALGGTAAFIGTAMSGVSPSFTLACIARIITGVGIGAITSSVPVYIQEMAPHGRVGTFQAVGGPCIPLTIFLGNVYAYYILGTNRDLTPAEYCPLITTSEMAVKNIWLMAPAALIGLLILIVVVTITPESAVWDRMQKKESDWVPDGDSKGDVEARESTGLLSEAEKLPSGWRGMSHCLRPIVTGLLLGLAMQGTGINAVMFYAPRFMAMGGVHEKMAGAVIIMGWNLLTALLALGLVDKLGRRQLLLPGLGLMAVSLLLMDAVYNAIQAGSIGSIWCFVLLFMFIAGFEFGPGTLFAVIVNETLPEQVLATASPLIGMSMGIMGILVTFVFPAVEAALGSGVFYIFGLVALFSLVFFFCCLPETKDRDKRQISHAMLHGKWLLFGNSE